MKNRYVIGFYFNLKGVVLIEKSEGQFAGQVKGIGGKIEKNETPKKAIAREFLEEAGIQTEPQDWSYVITLVMPDYELNVFQMRGPYIIDFCSSYEGVARTYSDLPSNMERTDRWLYWLCCDPSITGAYVRGSLHE